MSRPVVNVAVRAARAAEKVILRYMNRLDNLQVIEKYHLDFASEVDRLAEETIIGELKRAYPRYGIIAEESGTMKGSDRFTWVIDPLDGTHNYLRGIPHFCISIALLERNTPVGAVVYDPLRSELFTASKGDGAYINDRRIRVSKREKLDGAMIATGFSYRQRPNLATQLAMMSRLLEQAEDIRRTGSAALDLAYVAAGRFDSYFEFGLNIWDFAAGCLLVREAGGTYTDLAGRDGLPENGNLIAGNRHMAEAMSHIATSTLDKQLLRA